jgi:hypothetical protein
VLVPSIGVRSVAGKDARPDQVSNSAPAALGRGRAPGPEARRRPAERPPPRDAPGPGLVKCHTSAQADFCASDAWQHKFPDASLVPMAAAMFPQLPAWAGEEGPRWQVTVGPGIARVGTKDRAKEARTRERNAGYVEMRPREDEQVPLFRVFDGREVPGRDHKRADVAATFHDHPDRAVPVRYAAKGFCAGCAKPFTGRRRVPYWVRTCRSCGYSHEVQGDQVPPPKVKGCKGCYPGKLKGSIRGFSRESRTRMCRTFCELDYGPLLALGRPLAATTLTYPGDWETVAQDSETCHGHVRTFLERYYRAWGERLIGLWKREFQDRGAPHYHIGHAPPFGKSQDDLALAFMPWLSKTWADIVDHPDPEQRELHERAGTNVSYPQGLKFTDPKKIAVYFSKHGLFGAKEYQHEVPELWKSSDKGTGRWWGYWGLKKATVTVDVPDEVGIRASRIMRRWARAQHQLTEVRAPRTKGGRVRAERAPQPVLETAPQWRPRYAFPEVIGLAGAQLVESRRTRGRKVRRRAKRLRSGRGWVSVNDGPEFAVQLAMVIASSMGADSDGVRIAPGKFQDGEGRPPGWSAWGSYRHPRGFDPNGKPGRHREQAEHADGEGIKAERACPQCGTSVLG